MPASSETIQLSEHMYRTMLESGSDLITLLDSSGRIQYASPSVEKILGYRPEELYGLNAFDFLHPDDHESTSRLFRETVEQHGPGRPVEFRIRHKTGAWRILEGAGRTLAENGTDTLLLNMRDVTRRMESERQIRLQGSLLDQVGQAVIGADQNQRIVYMNSAAGSLLGWEVDEALGRPLKEVLPTNFSVLQSLNIMRTLAAGKVWRGERLIRARNGAETPVEVAYSPIRDHSGKQIGTIGIAFDITDRVQAERSIRTRSEELARLFAFSRSLAATDDLEEALMLSTRRAVELTHSTYAAIALLEDDELVLRAVKPIRLLEKALQLGQGIQLTELPNFSRTLLGDEPKVIRVEDAGLTRAEREMFLPGHIITLCLVPLSVGSSRSETRQPLGMLVIGEARSPDREPFGAEKLRLAQSIGDQAAVAIRRLVLHEETQRRVQQFAALAEIDRAIIARLDLDRTLKIILEQALPNLGADAGCVLMMNPVTRTLEFIQGRGFLTSVIEKTAQPIESGLAGAAVFDRAMKMQNLLDAENTFERPELLVAEGFAFYTVVPLVTNEQVNGVLEIFYRRPTRPDQEQIDFLSALAGQTAIAIDNRQLLNDLQSSLIELASAYDATIQGWSHAMDLRDHETEGHTQRVTEMSMVLARAMGFSTEELAHLRRGALLHDIGKMGVPDAVLLKPGAFTPEERKIMERHPQFAFEMLSPIAFLKPALDIPYCHHERWDGTGYPRGLKAEQIPLAARLFAVVDVWDALRSDRPYRDAWTHEAARAYIVENAGRHFDPAAVEHFIRMLDRGEFQPYMQRTSRED